MRSTLDAVMEISNLVEVHLDVHCSGVRPVGGDCTPAGTVLRCIIWSSHFLHSYCIEGSIAQGLPVDTWLIAVA